MAEDPHDDVNHDTVVGKAIVRWVVLSTPVVIVALTFVILLIADTTLLEAIQTAALPGVLIGVFGGGFVGIATTME